MFMRTYASSRVKRESFYRKSKLQMFLLISGGHIGAPKRCTNMASHTKIYKGAWNVSPNNSETTGHKDLRLGQIVYMLVFYNISFSWFLPLDSFQFNFLLRDSENDLLYWNFLGSCPVTVINRVTAIYRAVVYRSDCSFKINRPQRSP